MSDVVCANAFVKGLLIEQVEQSSFTPSNKRKQVEHINELPNCSDGVSIQFDPSKKRGEKKKREPSAYNIFVGQCMKGGNKGMKQCATEWKEQKR